MIKASSKSSPTGDIWLFSNYGYNAIFLGRTRWTQNKTPNKLSRIQKPSNMTILAESASHNRSTYPDAGSYYAYAYYSEGSHAPRPGHGNTCQFVTVDGHVGSIQSISTADLETRIKSLYEENRFGSCKKGPNQWTPDGLKDTLSN